MTFLPKQSRALALALLMLGTAYSARAGGLDDFRLSFLAGYGLEFEPELVHGPNLTARADLRLGRMTSMSVFGLYDWHGLGGEAASSLALLGAGIRLDLDVFEVVPLACLGLGWLMVDRQHQTPAHGLGLQLALGLEYLLSESLYLAVQVQYLALLSAPDLMPAGLVFSLGVGWHRW